MLVIVVGKSIEGSAVHPLNALFPIEVMDDGIVIADNDVHPLKALLPIEDTIPPTDTLANDAEYADTLSKDNVVFPSFSTYTVVLSVNSSSALYRVILWYTALPLNITLVMLDELKSHFIISLLLYLIISDNFICYVSGIA